MTLIMFDQWDDAALVVTDTLTSQSIDEPAGFSSKVWALPHLNMAYTLTGPAALGVLLYAHLNDSLLDDVDAANRIIPAMLRSIRETLERDHGELGRSRVFLFGFPNGSESIVSYQYSSTDDFEPVEPDNPFQGTRFGLVPDGGTLGELVRPASTEEFVALATCVREHNDQRIAFNPTAIGGDLFLTIIKNWNIQTVRLHRFPDYDDVRETIHRNLADEIARPATLGEE